MYWLTEFHTLAFLVGVEHTIMLTSCRCEPITITMVRARLWPATALDPRMAFTFDLLDWAEALLYECQVATKDFLSALHFKCAHLMIKV